MVPAPITEIHCERNDALSVAPSVVDARAEACVEVCVEVCFEACVARLDLAVDDCFAVDMGDMEMRRKVAETQIAPFGTRRERGDL
jgi:hypothetical protein